MPCIGITTPLPVRRRGFFFPLLLALLLPHLAAAQEASVPAGPAAEAPAAEAPAADLGAVEVREDLQHAPILDATQSATVILPEETRDLATTIPELLEQSPGVHVRRYGGLDDFAAIQLRGSSASQVQFYLDEMPLVSATGEMIDLSIFPLSILERVEVYRGGTPGMLPDASIGGAIVLRTKGRAEEPRSEISAQGGSFTSFKGSVSRAETIGKVSYLAAYERNQSEGDFLYLNNNGTTFNPADDRLVHRRNNAFAQNSLFGKVQIGLGGNITISAQDLFFQKEQGIPGLANRESLTAHLSTLRDLLSISAEQKFTSVPRLKLHYDAFFDFVKSEFSDPDGNIGLGVQENDDDTYRFGGSARGVYAPGTHQRITFSLAERSEYFLPTNELATPPEGPHSHRHQLIPTAEDEILLFGERLMIVPSLRLTTVWNHLSGNDPSMPWADAKQTRTDNQLSAKLGIRWRIARPLSLKANVFRGFRNPTFSELFGDRGTVVGNPALKPEEAFNLDAGLALQLPAEGRSPGFEAEASYFRQAVSDLIQYVQTSQYTVRAQNMSDALIQGAEVAARLTFGKRFLAVGNYTFTRAIDTGPNPSTHGKVIPGRPEHEFNVNAKWTEAWRPWISSELFAEWQFLSGNYLDAQNLTSVHSRSLVSVGAAATFCKGIRLAMVTRNLLNERVSDLVGYPLPGRSYWGTMTVTW